MMGRLMGSMMNDTMNGKQRAELAPALKRMLNMLMMVLICFTLTAGDGLWAGGGDEEAINDFIKQRKRALKSMSGLNIAATAGYNGQTADGGRKDTANKNLYQLSLGVAVTKESYPGEFSFSTSTSLVSQDGVTLENGTLLSLSYEHNLAPWLETYGFIQRFGNTFLSVSYRYEFGGGFKGEFNILPDKWKAKSDNSHVVMNQYDKFINELQKAAKEGSNVGELLEQLEDLRRHEEGVIGKARKKTSLLNLGMAVSIFSELEKSALDVEVNRINLAEQQQRFRLTLRPSFTFRPIKRVTIKGMFYYKHPLTRLGDEAKNNYRTDTTLSAMLNLSGGDSWAKSVDLIFEYQQHFSRFPFGLTESQMVVYDINNNHEIVQIKLSFLF